MPVIGFLNIASPGGYAPMVAAFRQGLKETGYVEGQNVAVEYRWSAFTRPALETVSIEKPYEQFKVGIIAVVRRRGGPRWWDGEHGFWGVDLSTRHPPPHQICWPGDGCVPSTD
jgi:hypothetical protein